MKNKLHEEGSRIKIKVSIKLSVLKGDCLDSMEAVGKNYRIVGSQNPLYIIKLCILKYTMSYR